LGSSISIYPTTRRLSIVGVNSPLRLLSINGILEPTQKPPRSPKCNFGKIEFSIENSAQFSLENITNL